MGYYKKGQLVIIDETVLRDGKFVRQARGNQPKVMGIVDNYAMVRFSGAMPFVVSLRELDKWNAQL